MNTVQWNIPMSNMRSQQCSWYMSASVYKYTNVSHITHLPHHHHPISTQINQSPAIVSNDSSIRTLCNLSLPPKPKPIQQLWSQQATKTEWSLQQTWRHHPHHPPPQYSIDMPQLRNDDWILAEWKHNWMDSIHWQTVCCTHYPVNKIQVV